MPANRFNGFTDFGVGIGLRVPHYSHILSEKPVVDWFANSKLSEEVQAAKIQGYSAHAAELGWFCGKAPDFIGVQ